MTTKNLCNLIATSTDLPKPLRKAIADMVSDYFKTPTDTEQAVSVSALLDGQAAADLLDEQAAARLLDNSPGTLSVWRSTGRYNLPFIKIGRNVRYRRADLEAWLEKRTRETGSTV